MVLRIKFEGDAGDSTETLIAEMVAAVNAVSIAGTMSINGTPVWCEPGDMYEAVLDRYRTMLRARQRASAESNDAIDRAASRGKGADY